MKAPSERFPVPLAIPNLAACHSHFVSSRLESLFPAGQLAQSPGHPLPVFFTNGPIARYQYGMNSTIFPGYRSVRVSGGLVALVLGLLSTVSHAAATGEFTGDWHVVDKSAGRSLSLSLHQKGSQLYGWHTAVAAGGNRIDHVAADSDGVPEAASIVGYVTNHVAIVSFRSGRDSTSHGTAELQLVDGRLRWRLTSGIGDHTLPQAVSLTRFKPVPRPNPSTPRPPKKAIAPR